MSAFADIDVNAINQAGVLAFEASPLRAALVENCASKDADTANEALTNVKLLCEGCDQWIEPYTVDCLSGILDALADKKTADAAKAAGEAILSKSSPNSIRILTEVLYESFVSMKWQTKVYQWAKK